MAQGRVERLDHLGLRTSGSKDLGLLDRLDRRLVPDEHARIPSGAAVVGMLLHGLGFAKRPCSCTPQCFAHTPLALLVRRGSDAEWCNRGKLGRPLDEAST